ncbi:MAG TPA: TIGR04283 family arsenosugar biosynthesis glycosyltransferase [Candidatus Limnocylindria bacterium]|nr:TIGR04283 family arsenosugar biosynthesis glycosyltransferase [Candidatus Limnocylindria bacterium]
MLSVVVPSHAEGATLLACVAALSRTAADEIVVAAHGEADVSKRQLRDCRRLRWVECDRASRGAQLNRGAAAAGGDCLLFLHADSRLPEGAVAGVKAALSTPEIAGGAFRLLFDARHPALRVLEALSALPWRACYLGDQGLFCRREDFEAVGGFDERALFEDVDFALKLARRGRLVRLPLAVTTSARRFHRHGPWRQLATNARLLALYHMGASPGRLARHYSQ